MLISKSHVVWLIFLILPIFCNFIRTFIYYLRLSNDRYLTVAYFIIP